MYLVSLRTRMKCPAILVVVCIESTVAKWCATPIDLGHPGLVLTPLVLGPDLIPLVTTPEEAAKRYLEDLMDTTGLKGPFSDYAKGFKAEGEAEAVIVVLTARGIPVTEEARDRITGCTDLDQLGVWIHWAVTVDSLDALFE